MEAHLHNIYDCRNVQQLFHQEIIYILHIDGESLVTITLPANDNDTLNGLGPYFWSQNWQKA